MHEVRHPAGARFEERDAQGGKAIEHTAHRQRGERHHLIDRERQAVHLCVVVEASRARQLEIHTRRAVYRDGKIQRRAGLEEGQERFVVEVGRAEHGRNGDGDDPQPSDARQLGNGAADVLERDDGDTLESFGVVAAHLRQQPVVVRTRDIQREAGVVVRRETDDQPAVEHLDVDALAVHVGEALVEVGRTSGAGGVGRGVDGDAAARAFLRRVELVADLRDPLSAGLPGRQPPGMKVREFVPRERVLVDVRIGIDHRVHRSAHCVRLHCRPLAGATTADPMYPVLQLRLA